MIKYLEEETKWEKEIDKDLILVDFYADWCGPCQRMGEVLEKLENTPILKVNTDKFPNLAMSFGVMSIPTLILFKKGHEVSKKIGMMSKEELTSWLNAEQEK